MADKVLVLGFKTKTSQKGISFTVNRPAATLTPEQIKTAMTAMIEANALGGKVTNASGQKDYELIGSIASAKYVTTKDTSFDF